MRPYDVIRRALVELGERLLKLPDLRLGSSYALGRAYLAFGLMLTLLFTPNEILFYRSSNYPGGVVCGESQPGYGLLLRCIGDSVISTPLAKWLSLPVLLLVITGWRPRVMAVPFWYVVSSQVLSSPIPDGGDHLALVGATLLLPVGLLDPRSNAWLAGATEVKAKSVATIVWRATHLALCLQVAFLYLHASIGKLVVPEWLDGTALWYWSRQAYFGFPQWARGATTTIFQSPVGVAVATYGAIVIELVFAMAALRYGGRTFRAVVFISLLLFHGAIALMMGLVSFFFSVAGLGFLVFGPDLETEIRRRLVRQDAMIGATDDVVVDGSLDHDAGKHMTSQGAHLVQ